MGISSTSAHSPPLEAPILCLEHCGIIWTGFTVPGKGAVFVIIVTNMAIGNSAIGLTLALWCWSERKKYT